MDHDAAPGARRLPLPVYNFAVTIDGRTAGFSEVSGLSVTYETAVYRHGRSDWEGELIVRRPPAGFSPVTLRRGVLSGASALYDWLSGTGKVAKVVEVALLDPRGAALYGWRIARAVPVKLEAPSFAASGNEVAIETLELMASSISVVKV